MSGEGRKSQDWERNTRASDRMIWGADWPHTGWRKQRMMNDAETVELLYRYVDNDADMIRRILVDNPARLQDFPR